ncbi:MAG TPA: excinuclease ABC subunit UvrC [Actinomycetota bacterium]|nr:excinuclease ABC subunit UvrC [Actinomycetota bacterium]
MRIRQDWHPVTGDIPDSAGVYLFRDALGRVIYVGKAKSLRHRVPNYFGTGLHPRTASLLENAAEVEWIVTNNEVEALQLEVTLIKQHQPRFNVRYRDDKSYPYLTISFSEDIPRAKVTRGKKNKLDRYYGPYAHAYAIRETLDLLLRVFPIRTCSKGVYDRAARTGRPCLLFHIARCSGPCVGEVSPQQHLEIVNKFCAFLDGEHDTIVKDLQQRMDTAAGAMEYEQAARARDQLIAVQKVIQRQEMVGTRKEDFDAVAYFGDDLEASFQVFFVRGGRVVGRKGFIVDRVEALSDSELVHTFLESLYADFQEVPKNVLVTTGPASREVLEEWLSDRRGSAVRIKVPERGSKRRLLETVERNAKEAFDRNRLKRSADFASRSKALNELQEHLGLAEAPLRIECFDISNLGPTDVVASMVVFEDALPKKSDYRKFKIAGVTGQDDFASMGEVIERRFSRYLKDQDLPVEERGRFAYPPGLVVVDGGKGQLNRTVEVMKQLGITGIPVVSLAKRLEEVYVPGRPDPIILPRGSEALYLMQRIRDEAHRFAVTFQRQRRGKRMTESSLDRLPGVGPARRKALLRHFGSTKGLREATPEEISAVPGIGAGLAEKIHERLRSAV